MADTHGYIHSVHPSGCSDDNTLTGQEISMRRNSLAMALLYGAFGCVLCTAAEPVSPENYVAPAANRSDEPLAKSFSWEAAANFLDAAAIDWTKQRTCFTCHTNYAYLMARPLIPAARDKAPA